MASSYSVRPGQTLADCALQATGTLESLMPIAEANGLAASDAVAAGTELVIPDDVATDKGVMREGRRSNIVYGTLGV